MGTNVPQDVAARIVGALIYSDAGATLNEIVAAFPEPPPKAQVQRWLAALVEGEVLTADTTKRPARYYATEAALEFTKWAKRSPSTDGNDAPKASSAGAETKSGDPAINASIKSGINAPNPQPGASINAGIETAKAMLAGADSADLNTANGAEGGAATPILVASNPATPPPKDAMSSDGVQTHDAAFAALFESAVYAIVVGAMPHASALAKLQVAARQSIPETAKQSDFITYGLKRLLHLTLGECGRLGIEPEQYALWRQQFFGSSRDADRSTRKDPPPPEPPSVTEKPHNSSTKSELESGTAEGQTIATKLEAIIDAALPSSAASGASPGGVIVSKPSPQSDAIGVSKQTLNAVAKLLVESVGRLIPGGLTAPIRNVFIALLAAGLIAAIRTFGTSSWIVLGAVVVAVGLVLVAVPRARPPSQPAAPATAQAAATGDDPAVPALSRAAAPISRRAVVLFAIAALMVTGLGIGLAVYLRARTRPSVTAVERYLVTNLAPIPVRIATLDITYGVSGTAGCQVTYRAVIETIEPLYRRLETESYLRTHAAAELNAIEAADTALKGSNGDRLREKIGTAISPPDCRNAVLLSTQTPPRTAVVCTGTAFAWRRDGEWVFTSDRPVDRTRFAGEPKPSGIDALAVDWPADAARLNALLAAQVAYATKVQAALRLLAAELEQERARRVSTFAEMLRPGAVFTGVVSSTTRVESTRVALEITDSSNHQLSGVLRNDGGWIDSRPFTGEWAIVDDTDICTVMVRTRSTERVPDAGPLLEEYGSSSFTLQLRRDGTATGTPMNWQLHLVDPAAVADLKTDFIRAIMPALDATKPGLVYRGTATGAQGGGETLVLRFTERNADGTVLNATLESAAVRTQLRSFRGTIIGNSYRANGSPIRLRSPDTDRSLLARPESPLGWHTHNDSFVISLRVNGRSLVGTDGRFSYEFNPTTEDTKDSQSVAIKPQQPNQTTQAPLSSQPAATEPQAAAKAPATRAMFGSPDVEEMLLRTLKNFAAQPGAYVLFEGEWVPLPKNNGRWVQTVAQAANSKLTALNRWEDKIAGKSSADARPTASNGKPTTALPGSEFKAAPTAAPLPVAQIMFDGRKRVPTVSGKNLTLLFIGPVTTISPEVLAQYPDLKTYPLVEVAPMKTLSNGTRIAPLVEIAPGLIAFGPNRVDAMLETPGEDFTFVRCTVPLTPGRYALSAGPQSFEINVE